MKTVVNNLVFKNIQVWLLQYLKFHCHLASVFARTSIYGSQTDALGHQSCRCALLYNYKDLRTDSLYECTNCYSSKGPLDDDDDDDLFSSKPPPVTDEPKPVSILLYFKLGLLSMILFITRREAVWLLHICPLLLSDFKLGIPGCAHLHTLNILKPNGEMIFRFFR